MDDKRLPARYNKENPQKTNKRKPAGSSGQNEMDMNDMTKTTEMIRKEKQALRKKIWAEEKTLDQAYRDEAAAKICQNIISLPEYQSANVVLAFVSMRREADMSTVLKDALASGKTLCVPLCIGDGIMDFRKIRGPEDLEPGSYGIMEPKKSCPVVPPEAVEFAVIPCVTCDRTGRRLGNGGGYYDRFLEKYKPPMAIVCREKLLAEEVPMEPFDATVPVVVTEAGVFRN